ncbi:MAG TPA: MerR family transcriptional regulator [Pseudogracilibacillus sp.]|nr:MerR family transcriptional regulator [Pseudogracilibacillus sp.]
MKMHVKELANLAGVSIRTLHHYDAIGLLVPDELTEAGYRVYSEQNLNTLQQILFFKALGFSLDTIKQLLDSPTFNRLEAFQYQKEALLNKKEQLEQMIETIDKAILQEKGDYIMTNEEKFKGFNFNDRQYEQEAIQKWGEDAVQQSKEKIAGKEAVFSAKMNDIYEQLARVRHLEPTSEEVQAAIHEWYVLLNEIGTYSLDAFAGLGQMYVADERFTKNIDQFGEGLAAFMCTAMGVYARKRK